MPKIYDDDGEELSLRDILDDDEIAEVEARRRENNWHGGGYVSNSDPFDERG